MKNLYTLLFITACCLFTGCNEKKSISLEGDEVAAYIELLKTNRYEATTLPTFSYHDIPALLKYRNETTLIKNFARNPISSYYQEECPLGMYVLWTIESIRVAALGNNKLIFGFPSQNPILALRHAETLQLVNDAASFNIAANAYYQWWQQNQDKFFGQFKNVDPLGHTAYRWH